jgi:hypothetical protein
MNAKEVKKLFETSRKEVIKKQYKQVKRFIEYTAAQGIHCWIDIQKAEWICVKPLYPENIKRLQDEGFQVESGYRVSWDKIY